jgi:hypothetical protein
MALRKKSLTRTVSGPYSAVQVVTLTSYDPGDSYKLSYNGSKTAALVSGTNGTAADVQSELRTLTGDASLTVTGTDNAGPFTVTFVDLEGDDILDVLSVTDGTGSAAGTVVASLAALAVTLKPYTGSPDGPYLIYRIVTSTDSGGSPTYEVTESSPGTAELADESPADVALTAPGKIVESITTSGLAFEDGDTVTFDIYYQSPGDRRF